MLALLLTLMALIAVAFRMLQPRWLSPAPMFAIYWLVLSALPIYLLPGVQVTATALVYIVFAVVAFGLGSVSGTTAPAQYEPTTTNEPPILHRPRLLRTFVLLGTIAGVLATAFVLRTQGLNLGSIMTLGGLLDTGNMLSTARYAGEGSGPVVPLLLAFAYSASLAAPYTLLDRTRRRWRRLTSLGPFLGVLIYSAVTTERLGMLLGAVMTLSGFLGARLLRDGEMPKLTGRTLLGAGLSAAAVGGLFAAIAFVRAGRIDPTIVPVIREKLSIYAFGYLPAFSEWLAVHRVEPGPMGWGTASLAGMEFITGQQRDATRSYDERATIDVYGSTTNIYTGFRSLLMDFGEVGTLLVLGLVGFLVGRAYLAAKLRRSALGAAILTCAYTMVLLSMTLLVTTFTNVVAAMILAVWVVTLAFKKPQENERLSAQRRTREVNLSSGLWR